MAGVIRSARGHSPSSRISAPRLNVWQPRGRATSSVWRGIGCVAVLRRICRSLSIFLPVGFAPLTPRPDFLTARTFFALLCQANSLAHAGINRTNVPLSCTHRRAALHRQLHARAVLGRAARVLEEDWIVDLRHGCGRPAPARRRGPIPRSSALDIFLNATPILE